MPYFDSFGMKHDGITTDCSKAMEEKSYIMFPEFLVDAGRPLIWSNCSRQAVTRFLEYVLHSHSYLHHVNYTANEQVIMRSRLCKLSQSNVQRCARYEANREKHSYTF